MSFANNPDYLAICMDGNYIGKREKFTYHSYDNKIYKVHQSGLVLNVTEYDYEFLGLKPEFSNVPPQKEQRQFVSC